MDPNTLKGKNSNNRDTALRNLTPISKMDSFSLEVYVMLVKDIELIFEILSTPVCAYKFLHHNLEKIKFLNLRIHSTSIASDYSLIPERNLAAKMHSCLNRTYVHNSQHESEFKKNIKNS